VNAALQQGANDRPVFVQAAVNVSYPREFKFQREDQAKLAQVAQSSGGRLLQLGDTNVKLFEAGGTLPAQSLRQVWDILLYAAALLFIVDVAARRLVFEKRAANTTVKVNVGQVAQAWRTARQRAADNMSNTGLSRSSSVVLDQGVASNVRGNAEVDLNSSGPLNSDDDRSMDSSISGAEIPLEQLPPLERLREAKRRARVDRDSDTKEPQS
jgi:hypothetical protein